MSLQFTKPEPISLKKHSEFTEKWVQERIMEDPSILGLGDIDLIMAEKTQPKAGRLDLLLHDDQLNRRYELELMLGATDPSHIMRCIEYWDIERRRYPAYDHVAVLVAEDITSRFLNVISLLAGNIPLIAIQFAALKIENKIALHFVRVLDQTTLRSDDEYEVGGGGSSGQVTTDRAYWEQRASATIMLQCDRLLDIVSKLGNDQFSLNYRKRLVDVVPASKGGASAWLIPKKTLVRIGGYVPDAEGWVKRFDDVGQVASLRRGNKAALVSYKPSELETIDELLSEFLRAVIGVNSVDAVE